MLCFALAGTLFGPGSSAHAATVVAWPQIGVKPVATGLDSPTYITHAGDGSGRLFITEQVGRIRIVKAGALLPAAFLDISARVGSVYREGGHGLIGLAFPPDYSTKRHFYVDYTNLNYEIVISRFGLTADADVADPQSETIVLTIPHPDGDDHYGGQLAFGPNDGYLYISVGDGGSFNDSQNRTQDTGTLLGKLLRIDVESGVPTYSIPSTNPFAQSATARREIWAYGLRNPWRFSFDRTAGDLYIGDVGNNSYEEIDYQTAASSGGQNYGWRIMEGFHCTGFDPCPVNGLTLPVSEYDHSNGNGAVTGGYVYRGPHNGLMRGKYIYGDCVSGRIAALVNDAAAWQQNWLFSTLFPVSTFGEDEAGNLYVADYGAGVINIISSAGVDGWLDAPTPVGGPPGGAAATTLGLGNYGVQTATTVIVTATLPAGLSFAAANPPPTTIVGSTLSWSMPDLPFRGKARIALSVNVQVAVYGTRYPINWQLTSSGPEANPADNALTTEVMVSRQVFLPEFAR